MTLIQLVRKPKTHFLKRWKKKMITLFLSLSFFQIQKYYLRSSLEESLGLTVHITKENALATVDELMVYLNRALLATQDRKGFSKGFAQAIETKKLILENNTNHE